MLFTAVFLFGACSALLDVGAKMTPAGHWRAYKRRGDGVEYIGGMGKRKPAPESPGRALAVFKIFSPSPR